MKWVTRHHVKVDRVACPWLIKNFVDPHAEFVFVPAERVMQVVEQEGAIPFDVPNVELGHQGQHCTFEAVINKFRLSRDPALMLMSRIVNGADTDNTLYSQPESVGLRAIAEGFAKLPLKDDHEILKREFIVYDALYAYCRAAAATDSGSSSAKNEAVG